MFKLLDENIHLIYHCPFTQLMEWKVNTWYFVIAVETSGIIIAIEHSILFKHYI